MLKPLPVLVVAALAGGGYYFLSNYEIKREETRIVIVRRDGEPIGGPIDNRPPLTDPHRLTLRLATFNPGPLDRMKLGSPLIAAHLATVIRDFDVVAIQGLHSPNQGLVRDLVRQVNAAGGNYDFAVGPEVGAETIESYTAILFDAGRIDIDRSTVHTVDDPAGRLTHRPLMALFRARGPAPDEAFTFVLVNVQVDPARVEMELDLLDDVFAAARASHPDEDDVILLGNFQTDGSRPGQLARIPNLAWAAANTVSMTRGTGLIDNIVFDRRATTELTGRGGVVDLVRRLNLSIDEAAAVSEHMPVWVEASVFEGGQSGRIAADDANHRR